MSKFSLFIMGGAIGLLCSGSPAAMAQAMSRNVSQTNNSATKTPVQIPKEGDFTYKARNASGQMLTLTVKWKAFSNTREDGNAPVSGDAKYNHPETKVDSVVSVDQTKSYLTKEGKLFVFLTDFNGKLLGPIDVVKLELERLEKSRKNTNTNSNNNTNTNNQNSSSPTGDKTSLKTTQNTDPSKNTDKRTGLNDNTKNVVSDPSLQSPTDYSTNSTNGDFRLNDIFKSSGEFNPSKRERITWSQSNPIKGIKYPDGSKPVSFNIYKDGKTWDGWNRTRGSYIDRDGFVHIKTYQYYSGFKEFKSKESFYSDNYRMLLRVKKQINNEEEVASRNKLGVKTLKNVFKDKKGEVVHTKGTAILGGLILSIGASNISKKESPLTVKVFNVINDLMKYDHTGWLVHRAAANAGLKVEHHKTRGRKLVIGQVASGCAAARPQYDNVFDIIENAPCMPWRPFFVNRLFRFGFTGLPVVWQRVEFEHVMRWQLNNRQVREQYAENIAEYLNRQNFLFINGPGGPNHIRRVALAAHIRDYLNAIVDNRENNNEDTLFEYEAALDRLENYLRYDDDLRIGRREFIDILNTIHGFQRFEPTLRLVANREVALGLRYMQNVNTLNGDGIWPRAMLREILHAMLIGAICGMP